MTSVAIDLMRRPPVRRAVAEGALVAGVALVIGVRILTAAEPGTPPAGLQAYVIGGLITALLPARRRAPLGVLLGTVALVNVYYALGNPGMSPVIPLAVPLYATAAAGRTRWAVGTAVVAAGAVTLFPLFVDNVPLPAAVAQLTTQGALLAALILLGETVRSRRALTAEAVRAAQHARRDREREADRRVTEERLRIARELHDVLAHTLAAATIQASVASDTLADDPATSRDAIDAVRAACREARSELAATVGILRADRDSTGALSADCTPVPGLAQLDSLLEMGRRAGVRVEVKIDGEPHELPPAIDMTAYRILQESLTNVLRHAAARSVVVSLAYRPATITVSITDDGRGDHGHGSASPNGEGGFGLMGMRERAIAVGGHLHAGNRSEGGYQVTATLPVAATGEVAR